MKFDIPFNLNQQTLPTRPEGFDINGLTTKN